MEVPSDADFDALVIGDQDGFPLPAFTGHVLGALFRKIACGEVPTWSFPILTCITQWEMGTGLPAGP